MKDSERLHYVIPVAVAGLFALLNIFSFYRGGERRIYDLLLHLKPPVAQDESFLFIDIDDTAIANVGVFPWSRDIMADGLIVMKEFDASYALFDIEYTEQSPRGVNTSVLNDQIPQAFFSEFEGINQNLRDLFDALDQGSVSIRDARDYVNDLEGLNDAARDMLLGKVREIARDNDLYLGRAAAAFERAFFTVNMLPEAEAAPEDLVDYVLRNIGLENAQIDPDFPGSEGFTAVAIRPAILPILSRGRGAGFPNVIVDSDGVRRRIDLIREFEAVPFAQLAFAPLLDRLGSPAVDVKKSKVVLKDAVLPDGSRKTITIPLTEDRKMLINWPRADYVESFRHISYYVLVLHRWLEEDLLHNLKIMEDAGYLAFFDGEYGLLDPYRFAESILQDVLEGGDPVQMEDYREARKAFFADVGSFLNGPAEELILSQIDAILLSEEVSDELKAPYREVKGEIPSVFATTREVYGSLIETRATLSEALPGSFCAIGWTGTSTTDIGVNPFEERYMNLGTHLAVANTILSGEFLDELPWWYAAILGIVLALAVTFVIRRMGPLPSILVGVGFLVVVLAACGAYFLLTGGYLYLLTPALSVFFTLIVLILVKFLVLEKEKSFLRNAFSHYLSTDVINELISDPEKLALGGQKKYLTAMFTDIRGFSSVSEKMDPTDLVKLLNAYLTEMSNIILDLKGTIDKYEGDAIIAFFGAPVDFGDHASRACLAAVRMKKVERHLNGHFLSEKLSPDPLLTRIGINTGEMVVGNMGTSQKMDYTIMGNSVNLASRLEGVNKQYGTWTLITEETYRKAGSEFTVRQMDRVRVVGISLPVRIYELVDERSAAGPDVLEAIDLFHKGQERFERKQWDEALGLFEKALRVLPGDGPSELFAKRCRAFKKKPPPAAWDAVFNLSIK